MNDKSGGPAYPQDWMLYRPGPDVSDQFEDARAWGFCQEGMSARLVIATKLAAAQVLVKPDEPLLTTLFFDEAEALIAEERRRVKLDAEVAEPGQPALTCEVVVDLLGLVTRIVPIEVVEAWTDAQRKAAAEWANAEAADASDNADVCVPPEPEWTKPFEVDFRGYYVNKRETGEKAAPPAGDEVTDG
jgi:hypothetical protein